MFKALVCSTAFLSIQRSHPKTWVRKYVSEKPEGNTNLSDSSSPHSSVHLCSQKHTDPYAHMVSLKAHTH